MNKKVLIGLFAIPLVFSCGGNPDKKESELLTENEWKEAFSKFKYGENRNFKVDVSLYNIQYMTTGEYMEMTQDLSMEVNGFNKHNINKTTSGQTTEIMVTYSKIIKDFLWEINQKQDEQDDIKYVAQPLRIPYGYGDSYDMYTSSLYNLSNLKSYFSYNSSDKCYFCEGLFPFGPEIIISESKFYFDETSKLLNKITIECGGKVESILGVYMYMEYNITNYNKVDFTFPFRDEDVTFSDNLKEVKLVDSKMISPEYTFSTYNAPAFSCDFSGVFKNINKISIKLKNDNSVLKHKISNAWIYLNGKLLDKDQYFINNDASILLRETSINPNTTLNIRLEYENSSYSSDQVYLEIE